MCENVIKHSDLGHEFFPHPLCLPMQWIEKQHNPSHPAVAFYLCYTHDFSWRFLFSLECTEESVVPLTHRSNLYHQLAKIGSYLLWSKNLKSQEIL